MFALLLALSAGPRVGPYVADVGTEFAEVRWSAEVAGPLTIDSRGEVAATVVDGIAIARFTGLRPDRLYRYHLPTGPAQSFHTLPPAGAPVSFAVLGDTRSGTDIHARLAARLAEESPDFVIDTGDLVQSGDEEGVWPGFFEAARPLLAVSPLVAVPGNHDERGVFNHTFWDRYFPRGRRWYEVDAGNVRLLLIDSNQSFDSASAQGVWIRSRLAAARAAKVAGTIDWIVTAHHHPAFSSGPHGGEPSVQRELVPLYETFGVDLCLSGHDHIYERLERSGVTYLVSGGGGAELYDLRTPVPESRKAVKVHHYLRVKTDHDHLSLEAVDEDGNVIDRASILRNRAAPAYPSPPPGNALPIAGSLALLGVAAGLAWWKSGRLLS